MTDKTPPTPAAASAPAVPEGFSGVKGAWYVVILLAVANGVSFFDRGFVSLVIDPIKESLHVTDTQIGLMIGPAFVVFYSTVSLPIARMADAKNRKHIILAGLVFWSACTGAFGMARNMVGLGAARMGVGLGEAALVPAGVSIINDLVPREKIGRAVSTFTAGGMLGATFSGLFGGFLLWWLTGIGAITVPLLGSVEPWQMAFLIISIPGLILAVVIAFTMREPLRRIAAHEKKSASTREAVGYIAARPRAVLCMILGFAMLSALSGLGSWTPTFFMRTYGLTPAQVGAATGIFHLFTGALGAIGGGWLTDVLRRRGREDANILVCVICVLIALPMNVWGFLTDNAILSLGISAVKGLIIAAAFGVPHPCVSLAAPAAMRSQAVAIYLLSANFIGIGVVPVLVPLLTDYLFHDPMALRYSLTIVAVGCTPVIVGLLLYSRKPFIEHIHALNAATNEAAIAQAQAVEAAAQAEKNADIPPFSSPPKGAPAV